MAQLDTYLVEKLREILERLYAKNKLTGISPQADESQSDSHHQPQQTAHKRSPAVFPDAPLEGMSSAYGELVEESNKIIETGVVNGEEESETSVENYYGTPRVTPSNDSLSSNTSTYLDTITYGVEVNCTTPAGDSSLNNNSFGDFDDIRAEDESTALTRNLHEFIHILKMSLKTGSTTFTSDANNVFRTHRNQKQAGPGEFVLPGDGDVSRVATSNLGSSSDPFSGIEAASTTDMEFNLTLDDILDLNNLLEGDESTFGVPLKHVVIIATYFIIFCVSIIGNLLVVQLVIRSRRFHTLTHALLANLAVADLFLATFNIPFSAARVIMSEWPFGSFLCRTVPFVQVTSVYATSFTIAVIAMDRYQVIMNPLGKRLKCSQGVLLVIAIWMVSAILSLPYALNHQVVTVLTVRVVKRCQAEFGSLRERQLLTVATFLAQYLLPLVFTSVSYISIMKRLWRRSPELGSTTPRQVAAQSRAKRKTIKMLVLTVICFALSWAPINIYHLLTHFSHVRHNSSAILICHMIAMSSSVYNPFIFCGLNEHFRREAVKWLHCFRTRRSPVVHPGTEVNGMLTRADHTSRRNISSTVVHTSLSNRRSPQQQISMSPRSCQRRRAMATATTSAVYITPRRSSPVVTQLVPREDGTSGNGAGPSGYQPELLFLVKDQHISAIDEYLDPEALELGDDDLNDEDFIESVHDHEWNSSVDCASKDKILNQSLVDTSNDFSSRKSDDGLDEENEQKEESGEDETAN